MSHNFFYAFSNPLQRRRAWNVEIEKEIGIAGACDRISYTDIIGSLGHASLAVLFMMELWYHG
jgi:hypothetical protein